MDLTLGNSLGYRKLTVSTSVVDLEDATHPADSALAAIPTGARYCTILVRGYGVNVLDDGETPTASIGFALLANDSLQNVRVSTGMKFIRSEGTDATLHIWYFD